MCSPGINGEGELRGQLANPGSPGKLAVKMDCVCVLCVRACACERILKIGQHLPKLWAIKYRVVFYETRCIQWSTLVSAVLTMYVDEEVWLGQFMVIIKCLVWGWYASGFRSESFAVWNSYGSDF